MKRRYTAQELWGLVNRADSHEKIAVAADFLTKLDYLDVDTYDEMMVALSWKSRELYRPAYSV